jgi:DNA (cytosine-5)-methyltransferase 1
MKIFYIDLFSGAGGTTTGVHLTGNPDIKVVACVNHDAKAIESHKANHPDCIHFVEDVRDMKVIQHIAALVRVLRRDNPGCIIVIWASLECTNYSKAKGGLPRDADSRTLAYSLYDYIESAQPDYVKIENVREFMSWGPLDEKGKPVSRRNGSDYIRWINKMCSYGYNYDWKILNSADFGAYTSRERLFIQFAKSGLPIVWPQPTHAKKISSGGMFENNLKLWKPVKEVLDFHDEGESIFTRKKPLVDATLERIYAGLVKFVANGEDGFIQKHFSGRPSGKVVSFNCPTGALTTSANQSVVRASFLVKYNSMNQNRKYKCPGINEPCPVVATQSRLGVAVVKFITSYYGNSNSAQSILEPCPTVTTKDRFSMVSARFVDNQYGQSKATSLIKPIGTITANPKQNLVTVRGWLFNPQFSSAGSSIEKPCFTLIARMDKRPPSLVGIEKGIVNIEILPSDGPGMRKIKKFMKEYGISDIKMRMLKIVELLKIQGFPNNYILKGSQADQKKFIGNAVHPKVARAIAQTSAQALLNEYKQITA